MLFHKEAESIVRKIVLNILDNVRTPERSRSPVGFYMTEQEQFQQNNPDVNIHFFLNKKIIFSFFDSFILITKSSNKLKESTNKLYLIMKNKNGIYPLMHYVMKFYLLMKIIQINKLYLNNLIKLLIN
jgi:hypothetical protein